MTRRESREAAIRYIFELGFDVTREPEEIIRGAVEDRGEPAPSRFAESLFLAVCGNLGDIDEKIARCADNWRFERIGKVTLAVLRLAVAELDFFPEIPIEITVNEALEIARIYDDEKSIPFINGVLGKLTNGLEKPLAKKKPGATETEGEAE